MTWIECAVIVLAGTGAGIINTVAGSGSLITFPVLGSCNRVKVR